MKKQSQDFPALFRTADGLEDVVHLLHGALYSPRGKPLPHLFRAAIPSLTPGSSGTIADLTERVIEKMQIRRYRFAGMTRADPQLPSIPMYVEEFE